MNLGQINIFHIIRTIIVADLPSCPVDTFNLDNLAIFDRATKGNCATVNYNWVSEDCSNALSGCHRFCAGISTQTVEDFLINSRADTAAPLLPC